MTTATRQTTSRRVGIHIALLIMSALALIWADSLYRSIERQQPLLDGEAGDLLLAEGFDDGGATSVWQQYEGRLSAEVADSALIIRLNNNPETAYSAAAPVMGDFDLRVQAQAIEGSIDNGFGVVFRLQEPVQACDMPLIVLCEAAKVDILNLGLRLLFRPQERTPSGYYMFLISSDGYYSLWRAADTIDGVQAKTISTWMPSDAIVQGLDSANEVRVVAEGNRFRFYINDNSVPLCIPDDPTNESTYFAGTCQDGQLLTIWQDDTFTQGKVGVVGHSTFTGGAGVAISFDNLRIYSPRAIDDTQA